MAEYYALQAALLFSIAHVFVRRGLVHSNALTGSLISLGTSAAIFWLLAFVMVPWSTLWTPAIGYFAAAGVFAPAIGQTLGYIGMERIGVARASPIVNTSPIFSSIFAVWFLGEVWLLQNIAGTCLVILGVIILSLVKSADGGWRKRDVIFPAIGAVAFGISTTLRKFGLAEVPTPLFAAAVHVVGTPHQRRVIAKRRGDMRVEIQFLRLPILLIAIGIDRDAVVGEIRAQEAAHDVAAIVREGESRTPLAGGGGEDVPSR